LFPAARRWHRLLPHHDREGPHDAPRTNSYQEHEATPSPLRAELPGPPLHDKARVATEVSGLTLTVNGRELGVRLGERVRRHREYADILIEQLGKLEDFERTVLEKALREHRERAAYLAFIRDHIDPDVLYRLEPSDLRMIDLAPLPRY
jgi:hypothetical protein